MKNLLKIFKTSKILFPVFITSLLLGCFLFFYIPIAMEDGIIKNIVKHSKEAVVRLQIEREYYTQAVVADVKKYAPNLSFDYNHKGIDGKLPFPTTTIHDLSNLYSQRSEVKFELYSEYPFLNRKNRKLTPFQKEAIKEVEKNKDGIFYKKDIINGKQVVRVAIADYMVLDGCVKCHNSHKLKDWDFNWEIGDKRGVLEVITPIDEDVKDMRKARNKIVILALSLMFILFIYYLYILLKREKELNDKNEELNENFNDLFEDFDKYVIASKTDLEGKITYASSSFCKISGYDQNELLGKKHNIIRHPDMPNKIFLSLWETVSKNKTWSGEVKNKKKDGSYYWVHAIVSPLYNNKGIKVGYSAIRHDITHKKTIEELNLSLEDKIRDEVENNRQKDIHIIHQSRLAQMGEMISMIAHQWRQPLTAINSTSQALSFKAHTNTLDKQTTMELSKNIIKYTQYLSETINDFRNFFKPDKKLTDTSYNKILDSTLNIIKDTISQKNIEIIKDLNCNDSFKSYENEIKQVLLNLIKNAEEVIVENEIKNGYIKIKTYKDNENSLILEVEDNGGGVHFSITHKIFDPYFSTKTKKDGTGLGLYMSKTIIEDHCNGRLTVENKNNGAVFRISLKTQY